MICFVKELADRKAINPFIVEYNHDEANLKKCAYFHL